MRDPHVVSLTYKVTSPETVRFDSAPPVVFDTAQMRITLAPGMLTVEPKTHFASAERAREAIDPFLRSWEIDAALRFGRSEIVFAFEDAQIVDRDPPKPGSPHTIEVASVETASAFDKVTVTVSRGKYPEPPSFFTASPDVETLWQRYQGYLDGREPLLSMAYFCLTLLESGGRNRRAAANAFGISKEVLDKLGELTSKRGDARTARKFGRAASRTPLTIAESSWVEEATKVLIRRVGETSHVATRPMVTMADLPPL